MKINHFSVTSATSLDLDISPTLPICVLRGNHSSLVLDLIRELIGDYGATEDPDRIDDGRFVIHADVEIDGKDYAICYIRNADFMGDNRIAVNFNPNSIAFSIEDTHEFERKRAERNKNDGNVFDASKRITDIRLSESERRLAQFDHFMKSLSMDDDRPLFIYDFFDRIDEALDTRPYLDHLASLGRQVFVSVCADHPLEKMMYNKVQVVDMEAEDGKN